MVNDLTESKLEDIFRSPIDNIPGNPSSKDILYSRLSLYSSYLFFDEETFFFMDGRNNVMFFDWFDDLSVLEVIELWIDFGKNINDQNFLLLEQREKVREEYYYEFQNKSVSKVKDYFKSLDPSKPVVKLIKLVIFLHDLRIKYMKPDRLTEVILHKIEGEIFDVYEELKVEYQDAKILDSDLFYFSIITNSFETFRNNKIKYHNHTEKVLVWINRFYKVFGTEFIPTLPMLKSESKLIVENVFAPEYYDVLAETIQTVRVKGLVSIDIVEHNLCVLKESGKLLCNDNDIKNFLKLFTRDINVFSPASCQFQWEGFSRKEFREMIRRWRDKLNPKSLDPFCKTVPVIMNYPYKSQSLRDYLRKNPPKLKSS